MLTFSKFGLIVSCIVFSSYSFSQTMLSQDFIFGNQYPVLSKSTTVLANTGERVEKVNLQAADQNQPKLRLAQKSSVRFADSVLERKSQSDAVLSALVREKVNLERLNSAFGSSYNSLNDFYFVGNFAHGFQGLNVTNVTTMDLGIDVRANYYIAVIPKNFRVVDMMLQREWFSGGPGGHAQIRFKLSTPILLFNPNFNYADKIINLTSSSITWEQRLASSENVMLIPGDVVYSLMAVRYVGGPETWGITSGIGGAFANAYTLSSTDHIASMQTRENFVEQVRLKNASSVGKKILIGSLRFANRKKETEVYHLIFNSCITTVMKSLSFGYSFSGLDLYTFNPYNFIEKLGLLHDDNQSNVISLNDEYRSQVKSPKNFAVIQKNKNLIASAEFDTAIRRFAKELLPYSYSQIDSIVQLAIKIKSDIESGKTANNPQAIMEAIKSQPILRNMDLSKTVKTALDFLQKNPEFVNEIKTSTKQKRTL